MIIMSFLRLRRFAINAVKPMEACGRGMLLVGVLLWLSGIGSAMAAELVLEVVPLRYRTVEQVLPVIQPLVPKPGTVSGMQSSLIVRTTRANFSEVRRVLDAIDTPSRRLMVTVRQDADARRTDGGAAFSGSKDSSRTHVYGTQSLENDRNTQQLQVLEGNEAFIAVGQSVPVPNRAVTRSVIGGRVVDQRVDAVEYRDVLSGFHVRPRVAGDIVTLEVSPQRDTPGSHGRGSINVQRVATTVSGRLGEWMEIGGIVSGRSIEDSGLTYRTSSVSGDNRRVLIKVDELP